MSSKKSSTQTHRWLRKTAVLCALLLAIAGFGGVVWRLNHGEGGGGNAMAYRFSPGSQRVYQFEYSGSAAADLGELSGKPVEAAPLADGLSLGSAHAFQTSVKGELIATVIETSEAGALVAYRLHNAEVRLEVDGAAADAEAAVLQNDLDRDLLAEVDRQGRILSVRFDSAVNPLGRGVARTLLALCQFVLPAVDTATPTAWDAEEDDPNGRYIARYEQEGYSEPRSPEVRTSIVKTKTSYLQPARTRRNSMDLRPAIYPEGRIEAYFDAAEGQLVSLSGTGGQTVVIAGKQIAREEYQVSLNYQDQHSLSPEALDALRKESAARIATVAATPLSATASAEAREEAIQRAELGDATLDALLAELDRAEESRGEKEDPVALYLKFKALIYLQPESCARLGEILATAGTRGITLRLLTGALGAVGNVESQKALIAGIRSHLGDWPALAQLIPALGAVSVPTLEAEAMLRELAQKVPDWNISSTAQLALGTMAGNLAESSPDRAGRIVAWPLAALRSSPSDAVTRQMLLVLGNAAAVEALPAISLCLTHPAAEVRAAATLALRGIDSAAVESLLIKTLKADADASVRQQTAVVLGSREITHTVFQALKTALQTDNSAKVRVAILNDLRAAWFEVPETHQLVAEVAAQDGEPEVRDVARKILETFGDPK